MRARFDHQFSFIYIRTSDRRLCQGDTEWSAIFGEDTNALALHQKDHPTADEQVALSRAILQRNQPVTIKHVKTCRGHNIEESFGFDDADWNRTDVIDRCRRAIPVHANNTASESAEKRSVSGSRKGRGIDPVRLSCSAKADHDFKTVIPCLAAVQLGGVETSQPFGRDVNSLHSLLVSRIDVWVQFPHQYPVSLADFVGRNRHRQPHHLERVIDLSRCPKTRTTDPDAGRFPGRHSEAPKTLAVSIDTPSLIYMRENITVTFGR